MLRVWGGGGALEKTKWEGQAQQGGIICILQTQSYSYTGCL